MKLSPVLYSNSKTVKNAYKKSVYRIFRKTNNGWKVLNDVDKSEIHMPVKNSQQKQCKNNTQNVAETSNDGPSCRENEMKIQMLSKSLYEQIFKNNTKNTPDQHTIRR